MSPQKFETEESEEVTPTEARQGRKSYVIRVLLISVGLVVLAFAFTYGFGEKTDEDLSSMPATDPAITNADKPSIPPAE